MSDKKDPRVEYLLTFLDEEETPLNELPKKLKALGVNASKMNDKIQNVFQEYDRQKKRQWRNSALRELESAKQKTSVISAASWDRHQCLDFLSSTDKGNAEVQQFFRNHSGKEPTDDDLRTIVEALLTAQALEE